jgi:hypothetical protein
MNRIVLVLAEIGAGFGGEEVFGWQGHGAVPGFIGT